MVRSGDGLRQAIAQLDALEPAGGIEEVALLIARCGLAREESRGAHFRTDFPEKRDEFARHTIVQKDAGIAFR